MIKNSFKLLIISLPLLFTACLNNHRVIVENSSEGFDTFRAYGKLNAIKAVNKALAYGNISKKESYDISPIQNEPYYRYAWHFAYNLDFGQFYGVDPEANIHIEDAWKITRGAGVTVAVIDASNFDWEHEDLRSNVIVAYNADENNNHISNPGDDDEYSHGSTVAGFIASPINGVGLIGAAPEAKLMLIKQIDSSDAATIKAFQFAKDNGATVINNSWGTNNVSQGVASALEELKNEGITIVFASGNEGEDMDDNSINDESELPSVIGVGASNERNDVTKYSNYGQNIDLIAPGGNLEDGVGILGLDDTGRFGSSTQRAIVDNNYAFTNGTSFSAPITTGVVALMLSVNPNLTPEQVREILITTADKVGSNANYH